MLRTRYSDKTTATEDDTEWRLGQLVSMSTSCSPREIKDWKEVSMSTSCSPQEIEEWKEGGREASHVKGVFKLHPHRHRLLLN